MHIEEAKPYLEVPKSQLDDLAVKYAELEDEYAILDGAFGELEAERDRLSLEYGSLLQQLKWTHAMLSILIEEQGGVVQVSKATLENYELNGAIKVYEDVEGETYIIEVAFEEEVEQ